jgi:hypothetical protein
MAGSLTRTLTVEGRTIYTAGSDIPTQQTLAANIAPSKAWSNGAGAAGEVDTVVFKEVTITPGSPSTAVTHDLDALANMAGATVDFAHLRCLYVYFVSGPATPAEIILGNSGADALEDAFMNGTTPAILIQQTGIFALDKPLGTTGWVVTTNEDDLKYDAGTFSTTNVVFHVIYGGND